MEVFWFCSVFGAGLCEPHLFALVAFLVEEFGQRVFVGSVVFGTMAEDVDSGEDGMTEAGGVCYSLSCYVVCRAVVGRGAHYGQSGGVVNAFLGCQGLERSKTLVVVHGQYGVEVSVSAASEESVGGIRSEGLYSSLFEFLDGRYDDVLFFTTNHAIVSGMRVEGEDGNAWRGDAEVAS